MGTLFEALYGATKAGVCSLARSAAIDLGPARRACMILGLHHVAISTGHLDRSLAFYRDLLGFEVVFGGSWPTGTQVADNITGLRGSSARQLLLRAGNLYVELFDYSSPRPRPGDPLRPVCDHGITHLCLDVDDLDVEYARLLEAGVAFHAPPQDLGGGVRTTYARDPDGNVVELQELDPAHRFSTACLDDVNGRRAQAA